MNWSDLPRNPSPRTLRQFGLLGLLILGGLAAWRLASHGPGPGAAVLGVVALLLGILGLAAPRWLRPIFVGWMMLAFPVGWLLSQLALALVYYGVLTPIGLALRATGRDPLALRKPPDARSYWVPKSTPHDVRRYFRQY
jgi:hypothetical protein